MNKPTKLGTVANIMIPSPVKLHPDITLIQAVHTMREVGARYLPVVDDRGNYLGGFSSMTIIRLLLPQSVSIKEGKNPFELNFMNTTIEELRERLGERGHEPITEHILKDKLPVCTPNTSIMEALNILYKYHYHVVITEEGSRRFLGVVTINGVLEHICKQG
ncbi:CBS domain-containing protein [Suttonella ornithocola]|uniref:Putative manganese-dependent inorganic pyrophosphatase n=1 Tax=Suttonella ornithocola TaxID=279832 RepID=A0A380MZS3_9GAMM|nr:CBS domain-containing protein [Suttonella ornithocola]SUO97526.1 putative manganese-dependent inorganic pyrophosphatase [Suttonella ornithocola]